LRNIPEEEIEPVSVTPDTARTDDGVSTGVLAHIEIGRIQPNPYQPRMEFDEAALRELADSIKQNGLVQPVTVRRHDGEFQLISGERRLRACKMADVTHIPAYIRQVETQQEMIELSLIENIQREHLNPVEIAVSYKKLMDNCGYTSELIAQKMGKDRTTVVNFIRILKLPERIMESIRRHEITMGHARALVNLPSAEDQIRLWKKILMEGLSVRGVEQLVREVPVKGRKKTGPAAPDSSTSAVETRLQTQYGTKVRIRRSKKGTGSIVYEFYSNDDLERILDLLLS
jgi:ParB family chromosome partitioning protein